MNYEQIDSVCSVVQTIVAIIGLILRLHLASNRCACTLEESRQPSRKLCPQKKPSKTRPIPNTARIQTNESPIWLTQSSN